MVHLHFQPLLAADKHSAGLGALVGSDDAFLFHLVHDTGRAGVAQLAAALQQASTSLLQRRCKLGYARAARIMDEMEEKGIIGPYEGAKPRAVLISRQQWLEMQMNQPEE